MADPWNVVFAGIAAVAAAVAVLQVRKSERTRLLTDWLQQYSSDEMGRALTHLAYWHDENPATSVSRYVESVEAQKDGQVAPINASRRLVAHYFYRLAVLWEAGSIDTKLMADALQPATFEFYLTVVVPIDEAHNKQCLSKERRRKYDYRAKRVFTKVLEELDCHRAL
jgi:hypothetical protein